jgi:hypothetical protein
MLSTPKTSLSWRQIDIFVGGVSNYVNSHRTVVPWKSVSFDREPVPVSVGPALDLSIIVY